MCILSHKYFNLEFPFKSVLVDFICLEICMSEMRCDRQWRVHRHEGHIPPPHPPTFTNNWAWRTP